MAVPIPDSHQRLFVEPVLANLATIMPDGRPQVHPVWCDYDGTYVRTNSSRARQKSKNLSQREWATLLLVDPANPFFWIEVRGRVAEITTDGAEAHIDSLAKKYLGQDTYPWRQAGEVRVMYKIIPERVVTFTR
jgi:PPOX class probable F420-dependent enzyme